MTGVRTRTQTRTRWTRELFAGLGLVHFVGLAEIFEKKTQEC